VSDQDAADPVATLSTAETWDFLATQRFGRLAVSADGQPDIFPVNYTVLQRTLLYKTGMGTKLLELAANRHVAFEVDRWDADEATSVVVRGVADLLERDHELEEARSRRLRSWVATPKPAYVRIRPDSVVGRRFVFGPEPDADSI
jgi:uncharacterized protein